MGGTAYRVKLFHQGVDVTEDHPALRRKAKKTYGYSIGSDDRSWSADSKNVFLRTVSPSQLFRYRPETKSTRILASDYCLNLKCANDRPQIFVLDSERSTIVDHTGNQVCEFDKRSSVDCLVATYWLNPNDFVAQIGRTSRRTKMRINIHSSATGERVHSTIVEPRSAIPFDEQEYASIRKSGYSLVVPSDGMTWASGRLLDDWIDTWFDDRTNSLKLATYRPTSAPYQKDWGMIHFSKDSWYCDVQKVWCEFKINFSH